MRISVVTLLIVSIVAGSLLTQTTRSAVAMPVEPDIAGESAIVIDAGSGMILYQNNATERLAPASLTKIFTAFFALDATPLQRRMTVVKDDLVGEASAGLNAGDDLSLESLLHGLMLASGNDAAMTIARNVGQSHAPSGLNGVASFNSYMNSRLVSLGLNNTNLTNPHGLDAPDHYSSAYDIAAMTMLALQSEPDFLRIVSSPGYDNEGVYYAQRNQLIGNFPGALGGKTGITDDAGYCLMSIAHQNGRTLISVVMGSTPDAWYSDSAALLDHGFSISPTGSEPAITLASPDSSSLFTGATASIQGMALQAAGSDAVSVRPEFTSSAGSWSVLRWPIGALLSIIVALVVAVQMRALAELQKRPRAKGRRPRPARSYTPTSRREETSTRMPAIPSFDETQPFATYRNWEMPSRSWSPGIGD